ncbi:MAG: carboxylesterase family protein [Flavobacteriales bacterium]
MKTILLAGALGLTFCLRAQLPYTENLYAFRTEQNVVYGSALNYAGQTETLYMDIYKPIGDDNCRRPILVLVHGGAWVGGSKQDGLMVNIAGEMARKGWVVAAINYRLGTHKTSSHVQYALCTPQLAAPCGYVADSAEVLRANYRGQQDAKGAIRFMKGRAALDSADVNNVFIAGESAGAFVSVDAAFLNDPSEKPAYCAAMPDAPQPAASLQNCLPQGYSLARPDLGSIDGTLNVGLYDASVQGLGSFYGGLLYKPVLNNSSGFQGPVYLFHQGSDVVVNYVYGRLLGRLDWECFTPLNLCQPYAKYPSAWGGKGLQQQLAVAGIGGTQVQAEIIENYEYMNDCLDNGHSVDNWQNRTQQMTELFAQRIALNGNSPGTGTACSFSLDESPENLFRVFPNPSSGIITINSKAVLRIEITDMNGSRVFDGNVPAGEQQLTVKLKAGIYTVRATDTQGRMYSNKHICMPAE